MGSGWDLRQPTTVTTPSSNGHTDLVHTTEYNAYGQVIATRLPSDASLGTDVADTTYNLYYGDGNPLSDSAGCTGSAAQSGLLCVSEPASVADLTNSPYPWTKNTYNQLAEPATSTTSSGTRPTTAIITAYTYDSAGRLTARTYRDSLTGAGGTGIADATYAYDTSYRASDHSDSRRGLRYHRL